MTLRGLILDMDGVLWHGDTALPGLQALFGTLERLDLPFVLATNNATKTVRQYVQKLARFGVAVAPEQVLTSPGATASFLGERYPAGTNIYVVGEVGLAGELRSVAQLERRVQEAGRTDFPRLVGPPLAGSPHVTVRTLAEAIGAVWS